MRSTALWLALASALVLSACTPTTTERLGLAPLETVPRFELGRYLGTWYEIASFPQWFQKGCTGTTAYDALRSEGELDDVNRCHLETLEGETNVARGRARVSDAASPAKLEVSFFRPFWGDYWIIDLAVDDSYAVVGHPGRDSLWILSRTPTMDPAVYEGILERLEAKAYPLERLQKTLRPRPSVSPTSER
jgi:apolipoprotein D and lipocalin family protein